ncbi:hypothetical protein H4Q26_005500 [Puccinia striiformis f. sp. tritici PST-130]|nr:hypothetical protein H4Q26_005500 [Puccinia striiformis f. sp. tritici PST-130]
MVSSSICLIRCRLNLGTSTHIPNLKPYGDEYDCFNHILANQRASLREEHVGEVVERIFQPINVSLTANDICGNSQPWSRAPVFVGSCTSNGECNDVYAVYAGPLDGVGPVFDGDKTVYSHQELTPLEGTVMVSVTSYKLPVEQEEFKYILTEVENLKWCTSDLLHNIFGPQGPSMKNKSKAEKSSLINTSRQAMQALNVVIWYPMTTDYPLTSKAFFPGG